MARSPRRGGGVLLYLGGHQAHGLLDDRQTRAPGTTGQLRQLGLLVSAQPGEKNQSKIDPGGDAAARDAVAIHHDPRIGGAPQPCPESSTLTTDGPLSVQATWHGRFLAPRHTAVFLSRSLSFVVSVPVSRD
jgi:hypothetical protein